MEAALTTLIQLQTVRDDAIPPYTAARFQDELGIFSEWFVSGLLGQQPPDHFEDACQFLVERTSTQHQCCVHRDYHCRNLLYNPADGQLGVVDFQDALVGPVSYDLTSLLHDCYHTFSDQDVARWRDWYLARSPLDLDPHTFSADLNLMAIQRQLKAVGIFARLRLRDGKTTHLQHILPVLKSLSRLAASEPELEALAGWLEQLDRSTIATRIQAMQN